MGTFGTCKTLKQFNPLPAPFDILVGGLEHEFYDFPYVGNVIIPTDYIIFFRGIETTNQYTFHFSPLVLVARPGLCLGQIEGWHLPLFSRPTGGSRKFLGRETRCAMLCSGSGGSEPAGRCHIRWDSVHHDAEVWISTTYGGHLEKNWANVLHTFLPRNFWVWKSQHVTSCYHHHPSPKKRHHVTQTAGRLPG